MIRSLVSCSLALAWIVPIGIVGTVSAQSDYSNSEAYNSKRSFFETSGFGALAVMPNVTSQREAVIEYEYIALPHSGLYRIERNRLKSPDWWFIVNHRSGSKVSDRPTYIGVLIAKRLRQPQARPLELFRNAGWSEPGPDGLNGFHGTYELLEEFFKLQDSGAEQYSFEQAFGKWHANPNTESIESSWGYRSYWRSSTSVEECFQDIGGQQYDESNLLFQARLVRFRVTSGTNSRSPVAWDIGLREADAFFIKTFSPQGADFDGEYCVAIE